MAHTDEVTAGGLGGGALHRGEGEPQAQLSSLGQNS